MPHSPTLLTADPFDNQMSKLNISVTDFFTKLYSMPKKIGKITPNGDSWITKNIKLEIENRNIPLIYCLFGYPGCGKTVTVYKLLYDIFGERCINCKRYNFKDASLGHEVNKEIENIIINNLVDKITEDIYNRKSDRIYAELLIKYASSDRRCINLLNDCLNVSKILTDFGTNTVRSCYQDMMNGSQINYIEFQRILRTSIATLSLSEILLLDYFWRIFEYLQSKDNTKLYVFYDNLDEVSSESIYEFILTLSKILNKLSRHLHELDIQDFVVFIPLRYITTKKIGNKLLNISSVKRKELIDTYPLKEIVELRHEHYKTNHDGGLEIEREYLNEVHQLMDLSFTTNYLKKLYNGNCRCVNNVLYDLVSEHTEQWLKCKILLPNSEPNSKNKFNENLMYYGANGALLHMIFDYWNTHNLFDDEHLKLATYNTDTNSDYSPSLSRLLLTYLYNKKSTNRARYLNNLYDQFQGCTSLININVISEQLANLYHISGEAWRRPLLCGNKVSASEDRKSNEKMFSEQISDFLVNSPQIDLHDFTKFSITPGGEVYVTLIITHFEFISCRIGGENTNPLFTVLNPDKALSIIRNVLNVVKIYCRYVHDYPKDSIKEKCELFMLYPKKSIDKSSLNNGEDMILDVVIEDKKRMQLLEERLVMSHLRYLDAYRLYLLGRLSVDDKEKSTINDKILDLCSEYLDEYHDLPFYDDNKYTVMRDNLKECHSDKLFQKKFSDVILASPSLGPTQSNNALLDAIEEMRISKRLLEKTIFISYSRKDKEIAEEYKRSLTDADLHVKIDTKCIEDWGSIHEYMDSIRDSNYALFIISDAFLKSPNCMYEVLEMLKENDYVNRIFPIVCEDTNILGKNTSDESINYVEYWEKKCMELSQHLKRVSPTSVTDSTEDLKHYQKISMSIDEFIHIVSDMLIPKDNVAERIRIKIEKDMV